MISGYAIASLVLFIVSTLFVIRPISIPTPRFIPRIPINLLTAPILAIAILWAAECLDLAVIRNGIVGTDGVKPYNILILFFSLAYMAITLDITGVLRATAFWVSNKGGDNGWRMYLYFYIMLTLLSILLGNDVVVLSGTAFLVYYTEVAMLDPRAWIVAEFAVANAASMILFVGNPVNVRLPKLVPYLDQLTVRKVIITEGFGVNNAAFTAYTILPFLACNIFCFAALVFQFRKYVPRKLARTPHQDPRHALLDPVGACVGSFMLGTTLALCLIVSFFGIDVWMISLPFAVAKFSFDLGWDHYRYSCGIPMLGRGDPISVREEDLEDDSSSSSGPSARSNIWHMKEPASSRRATTGPALPPSSPGDIKAPPIIREYLSAMAILRARLDERFPTFITALPLLPFYPILFTLSQFILIEALDHQGWVSIFSQWLVRASNKQVHPTIWLIGVLDIILCNIAGTNIGATILLTRVVREADLPYDANRAAAIALAVASNIGAVSFTFSASLAGLLWRAILGQKGIHVRQRDFAFWNLLPLLVMTTVGLGVVSAEMAVLF
ncbi:hypothetical protein JVU11DRAFT_6901 [Chiua virens]|nr:hypothetical protein JVU11DRAFT_6901 [Chiua virens]